MLFRSVKPWFRIGFHCAHISSVYGVLLYPILDGFARHAWLGPRTAARAQLTNADWARATLTARRGCVIYCLLLHRLLVPDPRAWARRCRNPEPGFMYLNGECFVIRRGCETTLHSSSSLCLTAPILGYKIWLRNSLVRESCAFLKKVSGGPCSTITPRSVK